MPRDPENGSDTQALSLLFDCKLLIDQLFVESTTHAWGLTCAEFASALERSVKKHFAVASANPRKIEDYLRALHLQDLALACACAQGKSAAWEHFVSTYRVYLRSAAAAILRTSPTSPAACELADSLFADLYGLTDSQPPQASASEVLPTSTPASEGSRAGRSLFRYFHGRSSLKTWLRAVLAQRHIDGIRASRRFTELGDEESESHTVRFSLSQNQNHPSPADPHRERYVALFTRTLEVALGLLDPGDKERLRLYYAEGQTLAEIGRRFGEHESSASRNLERTRRALRLEIEQTLRKGNLAANGVSTQAGLSEEEISLCFQYAAEDVPIDFDELFPQPANQPVKAETPLRAERPIKAQRNDP